MLPPPPDAACLLGQRLTATLVLVLLAAAATTPTLVLGLLAATTALRTLPPARRQRPSQPPAGVWAKRTTSSSSSEWVEVHTGTQDCNKSQVLQALVYKLPALHIHCRHVHEHKYQLTHRARGWLGVTAQVRGTLGLRRGCTCARRGHMGVWVG